jgi:hypothetical protein
MPDQYPVSSFKGGKADAIKKKKYMRSFHALSADNV